MKARPLFLGGVFTISTTLACLAQSPIVASFSRSGELVCTNLGPGSLATVEWAPSVEGPWADTWAGYDSVPVGAGGTIRLSVPMFYRVRVGEATPSKANADTRAAPLMISSTSLEIAHNANGEVVCDMLEPGSTAAVEWAASLWGPWTNTWAGLKSIVADSNGTIRATVPIHYRVMGRPLAPGQVNLAWIPAGTFVMGSPPTEPTRSSSEGPQAEVTISRGFWMGKYEVTQKDYWGVIGINPSCFRNGVAPPSGGEESGGPVTNELSHPVETVTWGEATNYCKHLTDREWALGRLPAGYVYRLPTEAEWEYACRAGTTTPFHYGNELRSGMVNFYGLWEYVLSVGVIGNSQGIYLGRTTPVGSYAPNEWGLYDMHGNVWEWCLDWYGDSLPGRSVTDLRGPVAGSVRVYRGGCWGSGAHGCRSACRYGYDAEYRSGYLGFRVVLARPLP